ncbi:uncharacterized protein O8D03_013742 [Erethizon dorsatum]
MRSPSVESVHAAGTTRVTSWPRLLKPAETKADSADNARHPRGLRRARSAAQAAAAAPAHACIRVFACCSPCAAAGGGRCEGRAIFAAAAATAGVGLCESE